MIKNQSSEESLMLRDFTLNEDDLSDEAKRQFPF